MSTFRLYCGILLLIQLLIGVSCQMCMPPAVGWFSDLMVSNIGSHTATIMWTGDDATPNAEYIVVYEDVIIGNQIRSESISGQEATFTYEITDLIPETNYIVQVCQPDLGVCGNCQIPFETQAAEDPSGPPHDLRIVASGPSTLTVSWSAPLVYPEVVVMYIIHCEPHDDPTNGMTITRISGFTSAPFYNLIPNTTYDCEVHTTSMFGNSNPARASASTLPRETAPGLLLVVNQNIIRYVDLTESTFDNMFFAIFEAPLILPINVDNNITGVDYNFHREELYLTLSSGDILSYNISGLDPGTEMPQLELPAATTLYTAVAENTLGSITVDWLDNAIYWIEYDDSSTKIYRMDINNQVTCEVQWEGLYVRKIAIDPVHGYMYWNVMGDLDGNGLFRGSLDEFRNSQSLDCPDTAPTMIETVFSSTSLIDFVLEPDVFIYFISDNTLHYIGFDKQNNGTIMSSNSMLVEAFGELAVIFTQLQQISTASMCSTEDNDCSDTLAVLPNEFLPFIDDAIVFRKSKQPLPAPPSYPADVYVFTGSTTAAISWSRPEFVQSFFGTSSFDDWCYCVKYDTLGGANLKENCTNDLQITLSLLQNDTMYTFTIIATGPGGEMETPNEFVFLTKPADSETAKLLISTNAAVTESNLDGSDLVSISTDVNVMQLTRKSNGVAYDIRSNLYFWIIQGGQGPLYRYGTSSGEFSELQPRLDTPVSLSADWVGRRLFWVQDGINIVDDRQVVSIPMDGGDIEPFTEDPRVSSIAVDSLNGMIFWITGSDIMMKNLNGLVLQTCISLTTEPLALTLDVEQKYLYLMTFSNEDNTAWLGQLNYSSEQCGESPVLISLPGSLLASSSRGVLTYGLGTLYLTTISSSSQSIYVFPANFARVAGRIDDDLRIAFGVIPQENVVRDLRVVSEMLQPLPAGLTTPGLSSLSTEPLRFPPKLILDESSASVIVIEWGESPTNISQSILYEVDYTLTPFQQPSMDPIREFTTERFLRLEDLTFFTEVKITVTPHNLWLRSNESLSKTSVLTSLPMEPGKVMNVRSYVYHPLLDDMTKITALIVWDGLSFVDAGGTVSHYVVVIKRNEDTVLNSRTRGNESYFIVRNFISDSGLSNVLDYPLENDESYQVQVSAVNDGGTGITSDPITFSSEGVSPPEELLASTSTGSLLYGSGVSLSYQATAPVTVNTISRLIYWYNNTINSIMVQSLDEDIISVFLQSSPINIATMAYEWQGERLYMAGFNFNSNRFELWRAPVVYSQDIEMVYQMSDTVHSVSNLVVDSFRQGAAYWLQEDSMLAYLNLSDTHEIFVQNVRQHQASILLTELIISALTLDPMNGELWVANGSYGGIFKCSRIDETCEDVFDSGMMVTSMALDESTVYWTNGSVIMSVDRALPSNPPNVSELLGENIISLHTLSPGQQPQYLTCLMHTTCLAPDLVVNNGVSFPFNMTTFTTRTSIEANWSLPRLTPCCAGVVFSYPLTQYNYIYDNNPPTSNQEVPFKRCLKINNLEPYALYSIDFFPHNVYTLLISNNPAPYFRWFEGVQTREGVPDPVDTLNASAVGITCINVTWSGKSTLRGPEENRSYFLTYGENQQYTINVGANLYRVLDVVPGLNYSVEVKMSNGAFNSTTVGVNNVQSLPLAPAPIVPQGSIKSTSFQSILTLKEIHTDIITVLIQALTDESDGINRNSTQQSLNSSFPVNITFDISGVSAFTVYRVHAVAIYSESGCTVNSFPGESTEIITGSSVPDAPEVIINNNGIATWKAVNPRSEDPVDKYILQAVSLQGENTSIDIQDKTLSHDLSDSDLNLNAGQTYNICVIAVNTIGQSLPGCQEYTTATVKPPGDHPTTSTTLSANEYAGIAVGSSVLVFVILLIFCVAVLFVYKRREKKSLSRLAYAYGPDLELSTVRAQRYHRTNHSSQQNMWSKETFVATEEELALLNQFPRQHLTLETFLGQGEFGEVFQGTAIDILGPDTGPHPVAIKTFRKGATTEEKHKFLSEAALMGKFDHPNIVKILAICVDNDPVFIIMELMPAGDLLKFLREARPESGPALLTREEQLHIAKDIAQGCRYLEQQHFIHRDLAARNCLVSSKGADRIVKIGDFGLAKDLYSSDYYRVEGERKLPVRWMAPEALLQGKFTIESDVWAYGVLLHEVMSFGYQPYPGQSNQDVLQFVTAGGRLSKPDNCPQKIYSIMMQCWRKYASERPRFEDICRYLDSMLEDMKRESYCETDSDDEDTLSREGSRKFPSRTPSFKSGFQNLVRSGSKKLRNSLRRHSIHRKEEQTTHTSENGDSFREIGPI